jgi:hypothetical protein
MRHTMHLRPGVAKQPNLELKTRPKQLLGSLPLVIALPGYIYGLISDTCGATTLRIITHSIMGLFVTLSITLLSAKRRYADCRFLCYAECRGAIHTGNFC